MIGDPTTWALVVAASFAGAVVGGVGGFGTGVILTAVLVPIIGVKAVVPVLSLAGIIINGGRLWFYRSHVDWVLTRRVLVAAVPCLLLGTLIYARLDARPLGLLVGALVILSIPLRRVLKARDIRIGPRGVLAGGALFGFTNGFASGMGVIMVSLLLGAGLSGTAVLATDAVVAIFIDVLRAALFGRFSLLDGSSALLGVVIGLVTLPGSALAAFLVRRMHARLHVLFMESLIVAGGAMIAVNSWR